MADISEPDVGARELLREFNIGYAKRDLSALDAFMSLFGNDEKLEVVGISGIFPGNGTWRLGREAIRELVKADWEYWGQIAADVENACVEVLGDVAWLSTVATVTTFEDTEESTQQNGGVTGDIHKVPTGDKRVKSLRMTAVLVKREGQWRFQQLHFSFPIRSLPKADVESS
jgi:hypothetical protein